MDEAEAYAADNIQRRIFVRCFSGVVRIVIEYRDDGSSSSGSGSESGSGSDSDSDSDSDGDGDDVMTSFRSGFCFYSEACFSLIFTNSHLFHIGPFDGGGNGSVDDMRESLSVTVFDVAGRSFEATILFCSGAYDLCALRINTELPALEFRRHALMPGMAVHSLCHPFFDEDSLEPEILEWSFLSGTLSHVRRRIRGDTYWRSTYFQASIGGLGLSSSGGPAVDSVGRVCGIVTVRSAQGLHHFCLTLPSIREFFTISLDLPQHVRSLENNDFFVHLGELFR